MNISKLLRGFIALMGLMHLSYAQATEVGKLNGQAGVSPSGAATYSIPIEVPSALSGLQPSISLQYNSQSRSMPHPMKISDIRPGAGSMGIGWGIGGLSAISRCPTDLTRDGFIDTVDYDDNDQFCLDGQRLVLISGSHGATGSEYRTETNGEVRVLAISDGPQSFKVIHKNGQVSEYGNSYDSKQESYNSTNIHRWNINSINNSTGNEINFFYEKNVAKLIYRISEVQYEDKGIKFSYDDAITQKKLTSITTTTSNSTIYNYNILWGENPSSTRTDHVVTNIRKCDKLSKCLNSTTFEWSKSENLAGFGNSHSSYNIQTGLNPGSYSNQSYLTSDVNGDGRADLTWVWNYQDQLGRVVWLANESGTGFNSSYSSYDISKDFFPSVYNNQKYHLADVNGDGKSDLIWTWRYKKQLGRVVWLANKSGDGFESNYSSYIVQNGFHPDIYSNQNYIVSDLNGDGKADLTWLWNYKNLLGRVVWLANESGTGFNTSHSSYSTSEIFNPSVYNDQYYHLADMNGDGKSDLVWTWRYKKQLGRVVWQANKNGDGFEGNYSSYNVQNGFHPDLYSNQKYIVSDVNGDGKADLTWVWNYRNQLGRVLWLANDAGTGFSNNQTSYTVLENFFPDAYNDQNYQLTDINSDGKLDILWTWRYQKQLGRVVWLANENGDAFQKNHTSYALQNGFHPDVYDNKRIILGDFNGDSQIDLLWVWNYQNQLGRVSYIRNTESPDKVKMITDGNSKGTYFNYKSLVDSSVYSKESNSNYPSTDFQGPVNVVSKIESDNSFDGTNSTSYFYEGMKTHRLGLGNLGFAKVTATNNQTGIRNITEYAQDYEKRLVGMPIRQSTVLPNGVVRSRTDTTYDSILQSDSKRYSITVRKSETQEKSISGSNTSNTLVMNCHSDYVGCTSATHDQYGNSTYGKKIVTDQQNGGTFTTENTNTFWPLNSFATANDYYTSQMKKVTVTKGGSSRDSKTRVAEFNEYYADGKLKKETVEPGVNQLVTQYEYETSGYGRITKKTVSGANIATRSSSITYDASNPYLSTSRNALNQTTVTKLSPKWGTILSKTNTNGLTVYNTYDDFGRKASETLPDGSKVVYSYDWCSSSSCPAGAVYSHTATTTDGLSENYSKTFFDALQRKVAVSTLGFNGEEIRVEYLYDALGRQYKISLPYFVGTGSAVYKENTGYDLLNRVTEVTHPNSSTSSIAYDGLETTYTNAKNRQKVMLKNALGETILSTDDDYKQLSLTYDVLGNLITTRDEAGNSVIMNYDIHGNKTSMNDPDKGHWQYEYNVLGQLVLQTDAKNQSTCMVYDVLGRMTKRIDQYLAGNSNHSSRTANALSGCAGDGSNNQISYWVYDTSPVKGIGKLHAVSGANGYAKTFTYDALGRVSNKAITIGGKTHNVGKTYYANTSKVDAMIYPTFNGSEFKLRNFYKPTGALYKTQDISGGIIGNVYWQATDMNARGQLTNFVLGNGVTTTNTYNEHTGFIEEIDSLKAGITGIQYLDYRYDEIGNLEHRKDFIKGLSEQFGYDELNRLTGSTITGTDAQGSAFREDEVSSYDNNGLGNIQSKTGVGIYSYGQPNAVCSVNFAGPHAVTSITGGSAQAATHYCYDENGNMVLGAGRNISYTAFGKPSLMSKGSNQVEFVYGSNRTRIQRVDNNKTTTTYVEGIYEELETSGGITGKYYIGNYAVVTKDASSVNTNYLHRDHLGSVDAITDANGVPVAGQQMSFDAWGKRRQVRWNAMSTLELFNFNAQITNRGYTNHEHVDSMGLIHMNGRVYDPILARFISADPTIQAPLDMQSYNRYSYVRNNPMGYTDPTGYSWLSKKVKQFGDWAESESDRFGQRNNDFSNFLYASAAATFGPIGQAYGFIHGTKYSQGYRFASNVAAGMADAAGCAGYCSAAVAAAQTHIMGGDLEDVAKSAAFAYVGSQMTMSFNGAKITGWQDIAKRSLYRGALGGTQSWASGGKFGEGFARAAAVQGSLDSLQYSIESKAGVDADPDVAPGRGVDLQKKSSSLSLTDSGKINIGIARERLGHHPNSFDGAGNTVLGGETNWLTDIPYEGSWFMNSVNMIPGMNYMSAFHDTWAGAWGMEMYGTGITILHATALVEGTFYLQHRNNEYNLRNSAN